MSAYTALYKIFWFVINLLPWLAINITLMFMYSGYDMIILLGIFYLLFATAWHAGRIALEIESINKDMF